MSPTRVALVGAAGETGTSIVNGLVEAGGFVRASDPSMPFSFFTLLYLSLA